MNNLRFIENYEKKLKERGIPKMRFYKDCEISDAAVSQWRTGKNAPSMKSIQRIADYLETSPQELLFEAEKSPLPEGSELDVELIRLLTQLRPEEAVQVRAYVQGLIAGRKA